MSVGEPLKLDLERSFSNPCSWNFRVGSKKQTTENAEQKLARLLITPRYGNLLILFVFRKKIIKSINTTYGCSMEEPKNMTKLKTKMR